jgi:hypothetical protein
MDGDAAEAAARKQSTMCDFMAYKFFIVMTHLVLGELDLKLPLKTARYHPV